MISDDFSSAKCQKLTRYFAKKSPHLLKLSRLRMIHCEKSVGEFVLMIWHGVC